MEEHAIVTYLPVSVTCGKGADFVWPKYSFRGVKKHDSLFQQVPQCFGNDLQVRWNDASLHVTYWFHLRYFNCMLAFL